MISRIGIIFQGPNDRGLLMGLRDRLGCVAEFVEHKPNRGKNKTTKWREACHIWKDFQQRGVQLVVRLTDAGSDGWQALKNEETENLSKGASTNFVCGVAPGAVERWLALDRRYLEERLGIPATETISDDDIIGRVKGALRNTAPSPDYDEAVRSFVKNAPPDVFGRWLEEPSFREFYTDCRDAALRENDCPIRDELRSDSQP